MNGSKVVAVWQKRLLLLRFQTIWTESAQAGVQPLSLIILKLKRNICTVYRSLWRWSFTKVQGFTKDVQLYLRGLLPSTVGGHTFVSALIIKLGLLDPEGCCVFDPNRKSIVKPRDLGAWLSLYHTRQSHSLTNQSFQQGGGWLNSRLCWEEKTKILKAFLIIPNMHWLLSLILYMINMVHSHGICQQGSVYVVKEFSFFVFFQFSSKFPELPWTCKL